MLSFADYSSDTRKRKRLVKRFKTIKETKDAFDKLIKSHPEIMPKPKGNTPDYIKL